MGFLFGVLLFSLAVHVAVIGLLDLGIFLIWGEQWTLSRQISNWARIDRPGLLALVLWLTGSAFVLGMLAGHFTNFRM